MKRLSRSTYSALAIVWIALGCSDTVAAQSNTLLVGPTSLTFTHQAGGAAPPSQSLSIFSGGASLAFTLFPSTQSGIAWLSASPDHGNTPATVAVSVNPASLGVGTHNGAITIISAGATNSSVTVPVSVIVTTSSQLSAAPSSLTFNFQAGTAAPPSQTLTLSTSGSPFTVSATGATTSGGPWLIVNPATTAAPGAISVGVNPAGLAVGSYAGAITLTPSAPGSNAVQVQVTLTVSSSPQLIVSPGSLQFNFQTGGATPGRQFLSIASSGASLFFTASTSPGSPWLVVGSFSGATTSTINVDVNPTGLPPGTYSGLVTITSAGASNTTVSVPVTLNVSTNPLLNLSPSSLTFGVQFGATSTANQNVSLASTGAALNFSVSTSGAAWLVVGPLSGTTAGSVIAGVNPAGLLPGTYNASIIVTAPGSASGTQTVSVTLNITDNPLLVVSPPSLSFAFQTGTSAPANQTLTVTSSGAPLSVSVAAATATGSWLSVTPATGTTPATFTVVVNPAGLAVGSYNGSLTITAPGTGNSPQTVPVTLVVSNTALLIVSPGALNFAAPVGASTAPAFQPVSISSTDGTALSFNVAGSGGNWLVATVVGGVTPANVNVGVNPAGLQVGTYTGSVTITAAGAANSPQTIAVTLTITSTATVAVSPASLSFTQTVNGPAPAAQTLSVTSAGAGATFTATATGGSWLSVIPTSGPTPATLTVSANGAALAAGTYTGTITIAAAGASNSPFNVTVTLTVTTGQTISASPGALSFSFQIGGAIPVAQPILVATGGASLNFTASASTALGGGWLSVNPTSGTTPLTLNVSIAPGALAAGAYNGTVTINAAGATNSPLTVGVTLVVTAPAVSPIITAVVNAGSFLPTAVAPGQIITIFGTSVGPATAASLRVTSGVVDTFLGDTRVLFDGIAAPMIYTSSTQVSAVVPYAIDGRFSTSMQVEFQGIKSPPVVLRVVETAPAIFTIGSTGSGQGAILNQNFSVNGAANAASKGSVVAIYATGEGQTIPGGVDGLVTGNVLRRPRAQNVSVTIGGQQAEVFYAGSAPLLVSGVVQVNARVPEGVASGTAVPVVLTIGGASSQAGVTMAVQ